ASYSQTKTYQTSLCLMYLDRLGEPADEPVIQILAVRLLVGQNSEGGWTYDTITEVPQTDVQRLKAIKPGERGKMHPEVDAYAKSIAGSKVAGGAIGGDDNSNSQFAVLAVWMARKHGVPVDRALDLVEKRYVASQTREGGWTYNGPGPGMPGVGVMPGSPSMFCAGLIGLATGVARKEEKHNAEPKKEPKKDPNKPPAQKSDDPFFNPPPKEGKAPPAKKKPAARPLSATDRAVKAAIAGLGYHLAESSKAGGGALLVRTQQGGRHGDHDLYFLWSVERVGVIYGLDKIGGVDWYEAGAQTLVHMQSQDGSWSGSYGSEVCTSFAILFLCRANLARDLSGKVQKETSTEMKAGIIPSSTSTSGDSATGTPDANASIPPPLLPGVAGTQAGILMGELIRASDKEWGKTLEKLRDSKGSMYTQALIGAVYRVHRERRKSVREALAERLTRMTAGTLRSMAKDEDAELRRAAVLAMAMKDDRDHIPDLIAALQDEEDLVVRAARAGLKSLSNGEDFGPAANATAGEKLLAAESWKKWLNKKGK
ncbi:MAG TPA: HEAT repeat domain-containing protein, partial [Gemmata sp.]|nr:HEAT repeat domain-containing protein [Gemmata sp.]